MYIYELLSKNLYAHRKNYSCNNVLMKCIADFRKSLDVGDCVGCILIDLPSAFDAIPHGLLIVKLNAYGVSVNACSYVMNYLSNRMQRVNISQTRSEWVTMERGVPQGSLTGPLLFNIFINDYILQLEKTCNVYNYAGDNTLSYVNKEPAVVQCTLEHANKFSLDWFNVNFMVANPTKFQAMFLGKHDPQIKINVQRRAIGLLTSVKLLSILIVNKLLFHDHVSNVCKKAAMQINVIKRLGRYLDFNGSLQIYDSFFLSNFNYCPLVYNSMYAKNDNKIETLNKRMLRVVCNDRVSAYSVLLTLVNRPMMYYNNNNNNTCLFRTTVH